MNTRDAVKEVLWHARKSQTDVAEELGVYQTAISKRIIGNPTLKNVNEILKVCGYKIVFMPEDEEIERDWYEVD